MKANLKTFPSCENCEVFQNEKTKTSTARAIFCEGLRAAGMCPKDKWKEGFEAELREQLAHAEERKEHWAGTRLEQVWVGIAQQLKEILGEAVRK